jgi:hypothetical protein
VRDFEAAGPCRATTVRGPSPTSPFSPVPRSRGVSTCIGSAVSASLTWPLGHGGPGATRRAADQVHQWRKPTCEGARRAFLRCCRDRCSTHSLQRTNGLPARAASRPSSRKELEPAPATIRPRHERCRIAASSPESRREQGIARAEGSLRGFKEPRQGTSAILESFGSFVGRGSTGGDDLSIHLGKGQ